MGLRDSLQRVRLAAAFIADTLTHGTASVLNEITLKLKARHGQTCPQRIVEGWAKATAALGASRTLRFEARKLAVRLEDGGVLLADRLHVEPSGEGKADLQIEGEAVDPEVIRAVYDVATADVVDGPPEVVDLNNGGGD